MKGASSTGKAGGAPQPAEVRQAEDGQYYTAAQFMEFYDDEAAQKWKDAAARTTASASGDEGDTPQLAADSHALARPCICTLQDIAKLTPEPNMGGKVAYAKQKELRATCLREGLWEIDVSDSWPQWRQVLRAMTDVKPTVTLLSLLRNRRISYSEPLAAGHMSTPLGKNISTPPLQRQ